MRDMTPSSIIGPLLILLSVSTFAATSASSSHDDLSHCENLVKNWAASSTVNTNTIEESKSSLRDLLFFLHVPRTGGRTFFYCFLRKLYSGDQECPRSYDKLRFDPSKTDCRLMVTHDDYSLMSHLPVERTSVVTILRNPVERVFSTYEFSVEVAARFLVHPNLTSATQMSMRILPKARSVSTLDIWPWKYLVPWMREDLFYRREARRRRGNIRTVEESNPYKMEDIVMTLHAFIEDPISHDIIHNGATFQVAGLTNNSRSDDAHEVRRCVQKHPVLGHYVLDVAKRRLDHMLYVGLTEEHKTSAMMFAEMVGAQIISQSASSDSHSEKSLPQNRTGGVYSLPDPYHEGSNSPYNRNDFQKEGDDEVPSPGDLRSSDGNMTVGKLMESYQECISSLRKAQSSRRTVSLKRISPVKFSKEARLQAPEQVLERIRSLNSLDLQLYEHARAIFSHQQQRQREGTSRDGQVTAHKQDKLSQKPEKMKEVGAFVGLGNYFPRRVVFITGGASILGISIYLLVRARRRSLKLKV